MMTEKEENIGSEKIITVKKKERKMIKSRKDDMGKRTISGEGHHKII